MTLPFLSLDFVYTPSRDVAAEARYFTGVLGGELMFAVEGMGARGALIKLTPDPPHILLVDHLTGDRPVLVYRVENIETAMQSLEERGWEREEVFEIPHGPCCSFTAPGGHRIAIYQVVRPGADHFFGGRKDF